MARCEPALVVSCLPSDRIWHAVLTRMIELELRLCADHVARSTIVTARAVTVERCNLRERYYPFSDWPACKERGRFYSRRKSSW